MENNSDKLGGNTPNSGRRGMGRPKGSLNKATKTFRETVTMLLEDNAENVQRWLKEVAEGCPGKGIKPDPHKALSLLSGLAEYATPKLQRTEHANDKDSPLTVQIVRFGA